MEIVMQIVKTLLFLALLFVFLSMPVMVVIGNNRQDDYRSRIRGYERRKKEALEKGVEFTETDPY